MYANNGINVFLISDHLTNIMVFDPDPVLELNNGSGPHAYKKDY